jgi:plasmid stability protein
MATLYIRNVPADLHDELRRLAEEHDRSLNAEILDLLRRAAERRRGDTDFARSLAEYYDQYGDQPVPVPDVVELIREGRDRHLDSDLGH